MTEPNMEGKPKCFSKYECGEHEGFSSHENDAHELACAETRKCFTCAYQGLCQDASWLLLMKRRT